MNRNSLLLSFVFLLIPLSQIKAQEFYGRFEYEYLENERSIAQTGSSTVEEYRLKRFGEGSFNLWNFHLDGRFNSMESKTTVESELAAFHDTRNQSRAVFTLGPVALVRLNTESSQIYLHEDSTTTYFKEDESYSFKADGIGLLLGSIIFGYFPKGTVNWKYDLLYSGSEVYSENIEYNVVTSQIIKQSRPEPGPYFDFNYTKLSSEDTSDSRDGNFDSIDYFAEIGWITEGGSVLWYGQGSTSVLIESVLESSSDALKEEVVVQRSSIGFSYPINLLSDFVAKRISLHKKTDVTHKNYLAEKLVGEDTFSIGLDLKERDLLIELKISNTYYERNIGQTPLITSPSDYSVDDTLVGFSFKYRFGAI